MKNLLKKISPLIKAHQEGLDNKKKLLIVFILLIIVYLDFSFLIKKQVRGISGTKEKIVKLKVDLDKLAKDLNKMQEFKNKGMDKQTTPLKAKKFILEQEIPSLIQDISDMANKNEVKILQLKPSSELKDTKKGTKPKQEKSAKSSSDEKTRPILITLDLSGDYHSLGRFINNLENATVFMSVENLKVSAQATDYLRQKANLVLRTYVKK